MTSPKRCKRYVDNCPRCCTGTYKRPARRKERHEAKKQIRKDLSEE